MKRPLLTVTLLLASAATPIAAQQKPPILDMHMHASNVQVGPDEVPVPVLVNYYPGHRGGPPATASTEDEVLRLTLEAIDRHNIVLGFLSGYDAALIFWSPTMTEFKPGSEQPRSIHAGRLL